MNRIFVDPSWRDGCTVWFDDGTLLLLKGNNIMGICEQIYNITSVKYINEEDGESLVKQKVDIWLDTMGIGTEYEYILKNTYDLKINRIKRNKIVNPSKQDTIKTDNTNFYFLKTGVNPYTTKNNFCKEYQCEWIKF